jgi:hypothetical protein
MLSRRPDRWRGGAIRRSKLVGLAVSAILAIGAMAAPAWGKSSHQSRYSYRQTYGSALRLVKVDLGLTVTDHDPDWGYLMFEYTSRQSGKRKSQGSFEFVRGGNGVQVSLQIPSMPSHHERVIIDRLKRKLSSEHGLPPRPKPKAKPDDDERPNDSKTKSKTKKKTSAGKTKDDNGKKGNKPRRWSNS